MAIKTLSLACLISTFVSPAAQALTRVSVERDIEENKTRVLREMVREKEGTGRHSGQRGVVQRRVAQNASVVSYIQSMERNNQGTASSNFVRTITIKDFRELRGSPSITSIREGAHLPRGAGIAFPKLVSYKELGVMLPKNTDASFKGKNDQGSLYAQMRQWLKDRFASRKQNKTPS